MKFVEKQDDDSVVLLKEESENGAFQIIVLNYLFGQKCIQVSYRETSTGQWWVIQEWRTYKFQLMRDLLEQIRLNLTHVEAGFGDWKLVESFLPTKPGKYLEDDLSWKMRDLIE